MTRKCKSNRRSFDSAQDDKEMQKQMQVLRLPFAALRVAQDDRLFYLCAQYARDDIAKI
jgi:predicted alpha/beta hydrolase